MVGKHVCIVNITLRLATEHTRTQDATFAVEPKEEACVPGKQSEHASCV